MLEISLSQALTAPMRMREDLYQESRGMKRLENTGRRRSEERVKNTLDMNVEKT